MSYRKCSLYIWFNLGSFHHTQPVFSTLGEYRFVVASFLMFPARLTLKIIEVLYFHLPLCSQGPPRPSDVSCPPSIHCYKLTPYLPKLTLLTNNIVPQNYFSRTRKNMLTHRKDFLTREKELQPRYKSGYLIYLDKEFTYNFVIEWNIL